MQNPCRNKKMDLNQIFQVIYEHKPKEPIPFTEAAEVAALKSGLNGIFDLRSAESAYDYIIGFCVMIHCTAEREDFSRESFRRKAYSKVLQNRGGGKWKIVEELQLISNRTPATIWNIIRNNFSPEDILGNIIPRVRSIIFSDMKLFYSHTATSTKPVKKVQFIRGFRDKGHLPDPAKGRLRISLDSPELESIQKEPYPLVFQEIYRSYYTFWPVKIKKYEKVIFGLQTELFKVKEELNYVEQSKNETRRQIKALRRAIKRNTSKERKS